MYGPTLAATPLARVSLAGGRWCVLAGPTLAASVSVRLSPDYAATRARLAVRVPGPGVVGDALPAPAAPAKLSRRLLPGPAPLHAVRVQQGDAPSLRSVTLPVAP